MKNLFLSSLLFKRRTMKLKLFSLLLFALPTFAQTPAVFSKLNTAPVTATTFADPTAVHNATYQYYCTAVNSAGVESAPSAIVTVLASVTSGAAPTPAQSASPTRTITISWTEADTGDTFNVYRKMIAGPPVAVAPPISPTTLTATVSFTP
jgi:hypothetical protein